MNSHQQFWTPREVPAGRTCLWRLGALRLWVQRETGGWRIAYEEGTSYDQMNASLVPDDVVPTVLDWHSLAWSGKGRAFTMRPELPDRPVVAKPEARVIVPAGELVTYYCLLPCWARFQLEDAPVHGGGPLCFEAWPTRRLSDTWFGDHTSGVLAYALAFPAGPDWSELPIGPHHVIVPVRIENESVEHLDFERLCLRTRSLGLYAAGRVLWSSAITVRYQGPHRASSLLYDNAAPKEAGKNAKLIAEPVERATRTLAGITFSSPSSSDFRSRSA